MRTAIFAFGREQVRVERVGNEYAVVRASGEVHEHKTHATQREATSAAIRLSNRLRAEGE